MERVDASGDGFADELARLKRQGASVLVVGPVSAAQQWDACRRLMGQTADATRRRVLVTTTGDHDHGHSSPFVDIDADAETETLSVISYDGQPRSTARTGSAAPSTDPSIGSAVTAEVTTLADLGIAISRAIESFERDASGLEPAELRVGVDSLLPLLEGYGRQPVFKFLHLINGRTRAANGLAHYHLPVERDDRTVPTLSPLFDVIVELRERNGVSQERWTVSDGDHCSGWLSVGPD
ncbi:DUF7504 family protein [Natrinema salifodinae]|uniref:Uncharacterized protein n=1 Tax=Natrinema salifodinae TaxID=1202768 RepID=A0A1I0Q9W9_9EURY|nr:hypothetical protein [Natrinema salifodinae]SEW23810.1 hypothetical protein SAMN05216285_3284 [Natrinema salifodinae]